jgi:hypothetical protein
VIVRILTLNCHTLSKLMGTFRGGGGGVGGGGETQHRLRDRSGASRDVKIEYVIL